MRRSAALMREPMLDRDLCDRAPSRLGVASAAVVTGEYTRSERLAWSERQNRWHLELAVQGSGPLFQKFGRWVLYGRDHLDLYAAERLSQAYRSTAEHAAAK
jgi:hypothetical protein